jgi:hypothetical protein
LKIVVAMIRSVAYKYKCQAGINPLIEE